MTFRFSGDRSGIAAGYIINACILCIILNMCSLYSKGTGISETTAGCDRALYEILNLKNISAGKIIDDEGRRCADSVSMYIEYLTNWNSAIETVLYEDQERYRKYLESFNSRLERINKNADKASPSYHIMLAEIYAHAGMVQIFYRDYLSGFIKIMKANNNARLNLEKYPDYWLNKKLCGVFNVSFDQMSPFLKKIAGLFNMSGNPATGFRQLAEYLDYVKDYPGLKSDALLYYGFALRMAKSEEKGYRLFSKEMGREEAPALDQFLFSNLMCLTGRNEEARILLSKFADTSFEVPFPFRDYLFGKVILNHLDKNADVYLKRFLSTSRSKNYKREVCSRLADYYLMNEDNEKFSYYRQQINKYAKATTERDREADVELKRPYLPSADLLKARYYIQGGYYKEASDILHGINPGNLTVRAYTDEYYLLSARIDFSKGRTDEAVADCEKAISLGRNSEEHYAAEAALLAGDILNRKGKREKAIEYYRLALEIKGQDDVYIENIEKIAKNRLNNI